MSFEILHLCTICKICHQCHQCKKYYKNICVFKGEESGCCTPKDVSIKPLHGGNMLLDGYKWVKQDGNPGDVICTDGNMNLSFCPNGSNLLAEELITFDNEPTELVRIPTEDGSGIFLTMCIIAKVDTPPTVIAFELKALYENKNGILTKISEDVIDMTNSMYQVISKIDGQDIVIDVIGEDFIQTVWKANYTVYSVN